MEAISTFSTPFSITAGGIAQLDIIMVNGQGTVGDTNSLFAFVNGLEITSAVPEPSSLSILGLISVMAVTRRRRR